MANLIVSAAMPLLQSIYVGIFGMIVVFLVLVFISYIIKFQANMVAKYAKPVPEPTEHRKVAAPLIAPVPADSRVQHLELINVEEKTAALIMAIVCDELQVPPEELRFHSIKAVGEK
jgi:sodium pump decarboxylase gamma subunit